jgi:chemotaxis protein MotB
VSGGPEVIIIKKKPKGHAAHGAAWKVAYADFVTAMMALFMVLWLVSQTDQKLKKSLSDYFRTGVFSGAPSLLEGGSGVADRGFVDTADNPPVVEPIVLERNAEQVRKAVAQALAQPELKGLSDQVTVKVSENGILIQIAEGRDDMLFDLSSSDLKPALTKLLADLGPTLAKIGYGLELHGHTDARPFAAAAGRNNWTLSFQRAERARAELEKNGVPPELIAGIYAHGSTSPIDPQHPLSPMNRRLAIFARRLAPGPAAAPDPSAKPGEAAPPARKKRSDATRRGTDEEAPGPEGASGDPR